MIAGKEVGPWGRRLTIVNYRRHPYKNYQNVTQHTFFEVEKKTKWDDVARARCGLDVDDPSWLTPAEQATLADGGIVDADPGGGSQ